MVNAMKNKLFVLSIDAMVGEDLDYLATKPNFSALMAKCAKAKEVHTIYPSLTLPAHVSIMTGCRAGKTGVYTNAPLKTYDYSVTKFFLYNKLVRVEDIFAVAKRAGCTTAAVYWPVTACNPNIDHNITEYFFYYPGEDIKEGYKRLGSDEVALRIVDENMDRYPTTRKSGLIDLKTTFDNFIMGCCCSFIKEEKPDLLMAHNCLIDSLRHRFGVFCDEVTAGLDQVDIWLGEVMDAMKEAGTFEDTNFVILSDHGQRNFEDFCQMNVLLKEGGFIDIAPDGTVYDWQAFAKSGGLSTTIFLSDPNDEGLKARVRDYLYKLKEEGKAGIESIHEVQELKDKYGLYGPFSFVVESDGKYAYGDQWNGKVIVSQADMPGSRYSAKHGYDPEKPPYPVFVATGPAFREGATVDLAQVIDEAPTFARILGQDMPQAEGRVLTELLK